MAPLFYSCLKLHLLSVLHPSNSYIKFDEFYLSVRIHAPDPLEKHIKMYWGKQEHVFQKDEHVFPETYISNDVPYPFSMYLLSLVSDTMNNMSSVAAI